METSAEIAQVFSLDTTVHQLNALEQRINNLCIYTRRGDIYPFDTVAGEMLAKALAISRSAILLIQHGYQDEAFGLCRSLYESAMYLRYITEDRDKLNDRSNAFLRFGVTSKAFWFSILDKSSSMTPEQREKMKRYMVENNIPDDPKRITRPWSDVRQFIEKVSTRPHPLDTDSSSEGSRVKQRAVAYTDTSSYVHCTQPGLNSYRYDLKEPILLPKVRNSEIDNAEKTSVLVRMHFEEIMRYCLFGMNVVTFDDLKSSEAVPSPFL